ncbi:MAG TPA: hypothetical protein DD381_11610 [Lentisphaeria bacterium]|nr:MAG: hypothetical protein A2X47_08930 [Lentisphaerae bacterium GWF2_38_69]HBM16974.1 hypothetical protein [Lentisphaeria bacterium]
MNRTLPKIKSIKILILTLLPIYLIFLSSCEKQHTTPGITALNVQTEEAIEKDIPIYIDSFGNLTESQNVNVKPEVSGKINQILFTKAADVKTGELLVTLDTAIYEANCLSDKAVVEEDMADAEFKKYLFDKNAPLVEKGAMAKQDFQKMKTDLESSLAKLETDKAKLLLDKINLDHCYIRSPIDGVIGINNVDIGNYVTTSDVLFNIKDISKLYIDFALPEKDIARLKKAMTEGSLKIMIYIMKETNSYVTKKDHYEGTLTFLNNTADPQTGTIPLRAEVDNSSNNLLPGQFADIKLIIGTRANAVLVPKEAVQLGPEGRYLYKINKDNIAETVEVSTLEIYENYFVLSGKSGISKGDRIVTVGLQNLYSGAKVNVITDDSKPDTATIKG